MRCRYEVYCGGRLLRVTTQGIVSKSAAGTIYHDSGGEWRVDDTRVADDVAEAMIEKYERDHPGQTASGNLKVHLRQPEKR